MVHWLKIALSPPCSWVQSLVGELRSHKLCDVAETKPKKPDSDAERFGGSVGS